MTISMVTPTWVQPMEGGDEYFMDSAESEARNKEYFLLSNTPNRQYEFTWLGLSDEQHTFMLNHYRGVSGEYAPFYWRISPQFYSLLGVDLTPTTFLDSVGNCHLGVTKAISCKGYKEGWGVQFDGVSDYLMTDPSGDSTVFNFDFFENFSISFWAKIPIIQKNLIDTANALITKYEPSIYSFYFFIYNSSMGINNDGKLFFGKRDNTANLSIAISNNKYNDNNWHHIVGTRDTIGGVSRIYLYIDNILDVSAIDICTSQTTNTANLSMGSRNGLRYDFTGSIDDVKIYNIALSATSVALLNAGTSTLTNCVAAWDFEDVSMYGRWIGQPESKIKARSWDMKLGFEKA